MQEVWRLSNPKFIAAMMFVIMVITGVTTYWLLKRFTKLSRKRRVGLTTAIAGIPICYGMGIFAYLDTGKFSLLGFIVLFLLPFVAYFTVQPAVRNDD
ncbi:MAG: hypothetical protein LBT22_08970 [Peptococcaceae bacterium]|jgi:uncharacterized membrane protein (DUF4010 family)|nr:hypothetical protein [Peptococcaceae bacterium]